MPKALNLVGKKFNSYTVLAKGGRKGTKILWVCQCDCGNIREIRTSGLTKGSQKNCGCYRNNLNRKRFSIEYGLAAKHSVYRNYKNQALRKQINFKIIFEEFLKLTSKSCYYCGSPPTNIHRGDNGDFVYQGIDRMNNDIGYEISNIIPCCEICNKAKRNMSYEKFIDWIKRISLHRVWER